MPKPELIFLPVADIDYLPGNPNRMGDAEFNLLCEGLEETGEVPPIFVGRMPDGRLIAIDGNHRLKAVRLLGWPEIPAYVTDVEDEDIALIRATRMNMVKGEIQRDEFSTIWNRLMARMDKPEAMRTLGVVSERDLSKLLKQAKRRVDVSVASDEEIQRLLRRAGIVHDLATIVRAAIGDGGGAGEYDYFAFQARGSEIVLLRISKETYERIERFGEKPAQAWG